MRLLSLIIVLAIFSININAQDCENSKFLKEGTKWEMSNFDKKDKLTGISKYESVSEEVTANGLIWVLKMQGFDTKGEETIPETSVTIACENGVYLMDFSEFMPAESLANMQDMEVEMTTSNINFPNSLDVNAKLEDATSKITTSTSGRVIMSMKMTITDRVIEGIETIDTQAGSMKCLKISQSTIVETSLFSRTMKSTTWFLPTFGAIRTESYNKNGKITGSTQLSSLTLP